MTESHETDYLFRMLQMNPLDQPEEILDLRRGFLKPETDSSTLLKEAISFDDRREQTIKNIDALRKILWTLDSQTLNKQIETINIFDFPDLVVSLSRLKAVSEHLESFHKLQDHPACFPQFYEQFCTLVTASPQRVVKQREEILNSLRKGTTDPRYRSLNEYYRIAKVIRAEMPELYALEKSWLEQIITRRKSNTLFGSVVFKIIEAVIAIIAFLVAFCIFAVVKDMFS
ncbi:hypothetical protein [uncultured Gimesia sp.]|uniref:hypothetical protein n=1 Tax=uncultured Gimesia sp. TaxID=1678688 RepID=UPI00260CB9BA|nr:hypothetical protein [uncultured Gimesia sp.]